MAASKLILSELRDELREHLGMDDNDLPKTDANRLLNRSYWSIRDKYPFREEEAETIIPTVIGTRSYEVPADFDSLRFIALENPDSKAHKTLDRTTRQDYENKYVNKTDDEGEPEIYFREDDNFILHPTPDKVYQLTVGFWSVFADLSSSNVSPELPQVWHEVILIGAVWRGYIRLQDYTRAASAKAFHSALINDIPSVESKEESDSRLAGISVPEDLFKI